MQTLVVKCTHNSKICTHPKMVSKFKITHKKEKMTLAVVFSFLLFSYSPFVNSELTKKMFLINSFYLIYSLERDII